MGSFSAQARRNWIVLRRLDAWKRADWDRYGDLTRDGSLQPRQAFLQVEREAGRELWPPDLVPPVCEGAEVVRGDADQVPVCDHCGRLMVLVPDADTVPMKWWCPVRVSLGA